jgi:DNA mismatch repair ATPase MutS
MKDSPAYRQYKQFKKEHPDFLLLFHVGKEYEAFEADAITLKRVLGTPVLQADRYAVGLMMSAVAADALEINLRKLIAAGHKVAICEPVA